jgi:hypothetical protein
LVSSSACWCCCAMVWALAVLCGVLVGVLLHYAHL